MSEKRDLVSNLLPVFLAMLALLLHSCGPLARISPTPTTLPTSTPTALPTSTPTPLPPVGTDIRVSLPQGDPERGSELAIRWECVACHVTFRIGPGFGAQDAMPAIRERAALRLADPGYTGKATTPEEYMIESILLPKVYLVEGEWREPMLDFFGERLTVQDLADIIAWLDTYQ